MKLLLLLDKLIQHYENDGQYVVLYPILLVFKLVLESRSAPHVLGSRPILWSTKVVLDPAGNYPKSSAPVVVGFDRGYVLFRLF